MVVPPPEEVTQENRRTRNTSPRRPQMEPYSAEAGRFCKDEEGGENQADGNRGIGSILADLPGSQDRGAILHFHPIKTARAANRRHQPSEGDTGRQTPPEVSMPTLLEDAPHIQEKPRPLSHDCSHEHSLDHWLEVYWMVEEDYLFSEDTLNAPHPDEPHLKKPIKSAGHHHKSALRR